MKEGMGGERETMERKKEGKKEGGKWRKKRMGKWEEEKEKGKREEKGGRKKEGEFKKKKIYIEREKYGLCQVSNPGHVTEGKKKEVGKKGIIKKKSILTQMSNCYIYVSKKLHYRDCSYTFVSK